MKYFIADFDVFFRFISVNVNGSWRQVIAKYYSMRYGESTRYNKHLR